MHLYNLMELKILHKWIDVQILYSTPSGPSVAVEKTLTLKTLTKPHAFEPSHPRLPDGLRAEASLW